MKGLLSLRVTDPILASHHIRWGYGRQAGNFDNTLAPQLKLTASPFHCRVTGAIDQPQRA